MLNKRKIKEVIRAPALSNRLLQLSEYTGWIGRYYGTGHHSWSRHTGNLLKAAVAAVFGLFFTTILAQALPVPL